MSGNTANDMFKWEQTYELSFELADVVAVLLDYMINYCRKNHIPLYKEKGLWSLVGKARCIFSEIEKINSQASIYRKLSDERKQLNDSDDKVTEPCIETLDNTKC